LPRLLEIMKSLRYLGVLLGVFCVFLRPSCAAQNVAGRVVNGTNNNSPAANVTIELTRPGFEREPTVVLAKTKTDAAGRFTIPLKGARPDDLLTARISWQGFTYEIPAYDAAGKLKQFNIPEIKSNALELTIFDSTRTPPPLSFTVHHVAITSQDRDLKCIERIVVENPSRRTYIGGANGATVNLSLPAGAQAVALDEKIRGGKLVKTGDNYAVTLPLTPQIYESRNAIIVNYTMPWKRGGIDLSRKLLYPTKFFFIAREEKDRELVITAPELGKDETQQIRIDDQPQARLVNSKGSPQSPKPAFAAGALVSMNVSRPTNPLVWAFVAFVGALCLVVPLTLLRGRAGAKSTPQYRVNSAEPHLSQSVIHGHGDGALLPTPALQECVAAIAKLDDDWQAGTIARVAYQEQRATWKNKALQMLHDGDVRTQL